MADSIILEEIHLEVSKWPEWKRGTVLYPIGSQTYAENMLEQALKKQRRTTKQMQCDQKKVTLTR